ncbi:MAG: hypothetical protein V3T70_05345 [Phycisphaerae bacterium]
MSPPSFDLLLRLKRRLLVNRANQLLSDSPLRVLISAIFVLTIWISLYALFYGIFLHLRQYPEQTAVAVPYIFQIFFVTMTVLLAFSTAVLSYAALFSREDAHFLMTGPTPPTHIVAIGYCESLFFASWSLVLLGVPLMIAIGQAEQLPWYFFVVFLATFVTFVPIPGALGLLAAWAVAMWLPRSARRVVVLSGLAVVALAAFWWARLWDQTTVADGTVWLDHFVGQLAVMRAALLPSTWASEAIKFALQRRPNDAAFYLYVTAAHGLFFSWLAVGIVSRRLQPAFGRASSRSGRRPSASVGRFTRLLTDVLFVHLPRPVRLLVHKDLKTFIRDPLQWSQLLIMLGLLGLYLYYLPRFRVHDMSPRARILYGFLNYSAVILIVSTFTSRFVYPMISMEGRQIWLMGLWPLSRRSVLWAKFQFALAVTVASALGVTVLSVYAIGLPSGLGLALGVATVSICFGLCGLAVGLGGRLPNFNERSAARVASGLGGTVNLVCSLCLVLMSVALAGWLSIHLATQPAAHLHGGIPDLDRTAAAITLLQVVLGGAAGYVAMEIGARHFGRAEF